jgi:hypothetical protein
MNNCLQILDSGILFYYNRQGGIAMPRGRRSYTLEEELEIMNNEIANTEEKLKQLKAKKVVLEERIKKANLEELDEIIKSKGLSFDQVRELLDK